MWTIEQLVYLAGIIDGEGTIYIYIRKNNGSIDYFPRFQVVNTNQKLMDWIHQTFGGHLYSKNRSKHDKNWRNQFEWYTTRKLMDQLLPLVLPYLIAKKPQAEIMIKFRKTFKNRKTYRVPSDIQTIRNECYHKLRFLNKRGVY